MQAQVIYAKLQHQLLSSVPLSHITVVLATVITGLLTHGMHASKLGLYWDDAWQFLQPMQAADGNTIQFILSDTFGYLLKERPFAHFPLMIQRAAFAMSLSLLHWSLIGLLIVNAVLLETIAREIVNENWYIFAVGVIFLTYPLSPLHAILPATAHYLWASLLALLAVLFSLYGLNSTARRRLKWFSLASITYLASILTHEEFALIPPIFVSLSILLKNRQGTSGWRRFGQMYLYYPSIWCLGLFLTILAAHGLWRVVVLPSYGGSVYPTSQLMLNPGIFIRKFLAGMKIVFVPWVHALMRIFTASPPLTSICLSVILFVITWVITLKLLLYSAANSDSNRENSSKITDGDHWLQAAIIGIALVAAALVVIGISPESINVDFRANSPQPGPRVNFVATLGIALALPALLVLLVQWYRRYTRLFGLASLACLIYVGFIGFPAGVLGFPLHENILSHKSSVPILFARYSLLYGLMVIAYMFVMVLTVITIILAPVSDVRKTIWPHIVNKLDPLVPQIRLHFLPWTVACMVLLGTLFHASIKEEFAQEWDRHKAMMEQLHSAAPAVMDDTFLVIVQERPGRSRSAPYSWPGELSCYLLALYDNWSLMGNTHWHLRFYLDGVESTYYGMAGKWFPPGVRGPMLTHATLPTPRISYDRLLLFTFDGIALRMLPQMEVEIPGEGRLVLQNNPERILNQIPLRTAAWRHITDY